MPVLSRVVQGVPVQAREVLQQALRADRPSLLTPDVLQDLSPADWYSPATHTLEPLDLHDLAIQVVNRIDGLIRRNLSVADAGIPAQTVHRIGHRRAHTAFERPHLLAQAFARVRRNPAWSELALAGWQRGRMATDAWSWGWVWSLPDDALNRLWASGHDLRPETAACSAAWLDSDGYSPWESLVQRHSWSSGRASQMATVLGVQHRAFAGGLVAAWRANNDDAQDWWTRRHGAADQAAQVDAWRRERGPGAWGHHKVVALERGLLRATPCAGEPGEGRGRRRL